MSDFYPKNKYEWLMGVHVALVADMISKARTHVGMALSERQHADILRCAELEIAALTRVVEEGWERVMERTATPQNSGGWCFCANPAFVMRSTGGGHRRGEGCL